MVKNGLAERFHIDPPLMVGILLMSVLGLVVLYSASEQSFDTVLRQGIRLSVGLVAMVIVAQIPPHRISHWAPLLYAIALSLLVVVLFFGTGRGVQRWLDLGFVKFQPSEIMKIAVPLTVASMVSKKILPPDLKTIAFAGVLILVPTALIVMQPDLGTSILVASSGVMILFFSGISRVLIRNSVLLGVAIAPVGWFSMHEYQRQRVLTLFDPDRDALGAGYHIIQSTIAVGSGGTFGKGWLNGSQGQLEFLPERSTDFIFAVAGEEFGLLGTMAILLLYLAVVARGFYIAAAAQDTFSRLLAGSISLTFFFYVFVNSAMVTGLVPVVGIPLPLISAGGTSMVTLLAGFGILMSIQTHRKFLPR